MILQKGLLHGLHYETKNARCAFLRPMVEFYDLSFTQEQRASMFFLCVGFWYVISFSSLLYSVELNEQQRHLLFEELIAQHNKIADQDILDDLAKYTDTFTHDEIIDLFSKITLIHQNEVLERKKISSAFKEAFYKKYSDKAQKKPIDSHLACYLKGALAGVFLTSATGAAAIFYCMRPVTILSAKQDQGYRVLRPLWYILGYK